LPVVDYRVAFGAVDEGFDEVDAAARDSDNGVDVGFYGEFDGVCWGYLLAFGCML
jgi:hypothetical protein